MRKMSDWFGNEIVAFQSELRFPFQSAEAIHAKQSSRSAWHVNMLDQWLRSDCRPHTAQKMWRKKEGNSNWPRWKTNRTKENFRREEKRLDWARRAHADPLCSLAGLVSRIPLNNKWDLVAQQVWTPLASVTPPLDSLRRSRLPMNTARRRRRWRLPVTDVRPRVASSRPNLGCSF